MKLLRKLGLVTLATLLITTASIAANKFSGFMKFPFNFNQQSVLVEPNLSYELPFKIKGYTFMDLYDGEQGGIYYGKTSLKKEIIKGINAKTTTTHDGDLHTSTGIGACVNIPFLPEGTYSNISWLPVYANDHGLIDKNTISYFISQDLPFGFSASSFGEWNFSTKEWTYGEFDFGKDFEIPGIGKSRVSYNPWLLGDGDKIPTGEHRLAFSVYFQ